MANRFTFRAWDKEEKKMRVLNNVHDSFIFIKGHATYYNLRNGSGGDEYILMQSTGLVDKNGKEIFEGDIIDFEGRVPWKEEVIWGANRRSSGWKSKRLSSGHLVREDDFDGEYASRCGVIVGNIYED